MLSQTDAVKQAWAAADRTLDIIVTVDGKDYQATEINSLNYDAGAFTGDTLGIGSTYENSVTIEFSSVVEAFKQGLTVLPKVGILVDGKFEYTNLGTFIMSEVNRDRNNNLTTIKALDQMCKLEGQYKPTVSDMASPLDIIADIANQGGVTVNTAELQHLPALPNIKKIEGQTLRTAIGWVAQLYGGFAAFDRDGKLTIRTAASPDYTITPGEYQQGGLTKNEVAYKTGGIKVTVNTKKTDDSGQEVDDTTTLQAGETTGSQIELTNDSMTSDLLTTVWTGIKDITYYPYTLNWFGNPNLEAGDWVTLTDTQGNQFNVPVNQYTMSFNGGLESTISATQSSSTAGGYAYTGSAGSIKNMIEALQVRHTASGNNVYPPTYQGQPQNPKKGDVWYKQNGNNVEVWIYQEDDGKLSWVRTPLDGEVKAELQALGTKTNEDLARVKNELSSEAESQWQSMKTATSEVANDLSATKDSLAAVRNDLSATKDSLAAVNNDLSATKTSLADTRDSLATTTNDLSSVKTSLADTRNNLATTTSDLTSVKADLADTKNNLTTTTNDIKNSLSAVSSDLSATKTKLEDTKNSLSTTVADLQKQTGQLSGSLSTANSKIEYNSKAIAEVKHTAEEVSTTVSNLHAGDRNYVRNTSNEWKILTGFTGTTNYCTPDFGVFYPDDLQVGDTVTIGYTIKNNGIQSGTFQLQGIGNVTIWNYMINGTWYDIAKVCPDGATTTLIQYLTLTADNLKNGKFNLRIRTDNFPAGTLSYKGLFVKKGNLATDWSPAPEDTDQAISKVSQTADAIRADLTNTKGDIASVKATANSLQSQITDNKNNISSVKQTADSLTTTVGQMPAKWQQAINDKASAQVLTSNVDMNNLTTAGTYLIKDFSAKNSPIGAWFMATVEATADHTRVVQRVKKDSANVAYERSSCDSGWTAWERVATGTDVSSIKQTMDSITTRVSNAEGNVSSLQQTASGLQSSVTNAQGDISDLKQKADSITTTLSQGGSNLLPGTRDFSWRLAWWASSGTKNQSSQYNESEKVTERKYVMTPGQYQGVWWGGNNTVGQTYTLSFDARCDNGKAKIQQMGLEGNLIVNSPLTTDWTRYHVTVKVTAGNHNWVTYFSTTDADNVYARKYQIEYGETATPWNHSSGDISSLQQTAQGLTADMKDAKGNISSLQATAQGLTTRVSNTEGNVSSLQQTATKLQSDLTNAKGDISSLQQTANGLTSRVGNAEGNISQLQQTANGLTSTVSNMKSGGANMLPAGKLQSYYGSTVTYDAGSDTYTIVNPASANAQWGSGVCLPNAVIEIPWGQTACISMQVYSPTAGTIVIDINNGGDGLTTSNDNDNRDKATFHNMNVSANTWTTVWFTYENSNESRNPKKVSLWDNRSGIGLKLNNVTWKIRHPMVQIGTFPSEWSPSPKDTDSAISQIKQTANQIQAQVDDNKGNIASVTQTANAVKTDLANTKGDVAAVKAEADSLTSQMADANGNISQLQQTAKGLQSTVTDQSGKISQLQQDTDGLSATVGGAAIDIIPNLDQQFVMGYGIANTTWQDNNSYIKLPTTKIHPEVLPQTAGFALNIPWQAGKTYMQSIIFETDATINDSIQPQWTWFTGNGHVPANATLAKLGNNTYRLIGSHTPTAKETTQPLRVFDIFNFTNFVDVTTGTYLKFRNPRIWCPDDNSLAQLKLTADGLTSKVTDAQGNISNLQQTATGLQTQMTNTQKDVSSLKVTAGEISADLTNAKGDITRVKTTADSLTTSMTNAQNDISTLQHRADSITSTLSSGGVNLLTGTSGDLKNVTVYAWFVDYTDFFLTHVLDNKTCTARVWIDNPSMDCVLQVWTNKGQSWDSNTIKANQSGYATVTFKITDTSYTDAHIAIGSGSGTVTFGYKELQIEYGETATPWKPSNGDISSLQQTAKELKATVGDDNTGLVSYVKAIPGQISSAITASKQATVITSAVDVHDMKTAGYYLLKGTLTNSPVDAWAFLRVITSDSGDRIYHQIWKDNASTVYTEEWTGGWSDWVTHINSDNLKSNVITAINQSTEGVSITGSKITLDGNVNVTPGFTLSADYIKAGTLSADRISGGTLNFSNITVNGLTANSISSGSISGQNLNINLDNGVVEFTKGRLHSTDGGFDINIDYKSFYLDMGNNTKLWIDGNGFHLQESASQHLWINRDGLHNYTDANGNGLWINDTTLKVLNSNNAGLIAKDGIIQFSANPIWNSDNVYSGNTLDSQTYGTIGFNSNLLSSSLNGIFIRGREGVVIGTNSYNGGAMLYPDDFIPSIGGAGINLPERADTPASIFTNSELTLYGGSRYYDGIFNDQMPYISIGCNWYYTHNGAFMTLDGSSSRGNQIYARAQNISFEAKDWINIRSLGGIGRIAFQAEYIHSYPTYNKTTSAGANVYVAPDGALVRSSSARKYKTDIQNADNDYGNKLIEFVPQKWIDKAEKKRYEEDPDNNKKPGYYYGLIADDLDAAGLDMLVNYGADGEVEGINYDRLAVALLPVIKSLKDQVASLKEQLKALTK